MSNLKSKALTEHTIWLRGIYMLIFAFILWLAKFVAVAVVVFQFLSVLFKGRTNPKLIVFGMSLSVYTYQIMLFLTFNSEKHPYPLNDWPVDKLPEDFE